MNLDFLGAEQNFTTLAGSQPSYRLDFVDDLGVAVDLSNVTFDGVLTGVDGVERLLDVTQVEGSVSALMVVFPVVDVGVYRYELRATSDAGERLRLAHGRLGVLSTSLELSRVEDDCEVRRLAVRVPGAAARHCMLEWRAVTDALMAAEKAAEYARDAAAALEGIDEVRKEAEDAVRLAGEAVEKLNTLDAKLAEVEGRITSAIVPNAETNTWWICGKNTGFQVTGDAGKSPKLSSVGSWMLWDVVGGVWVDTGVPAAGEDGHSPYVNALGHWCEWSVLSGEYRDTGVPAAGKDGVNGSAVRRIVVESVEDIPVSGDTCNGGFYYYVAVKEVVVPPVEVSAPVDPVERSFYEVYAWLEVPDGSASWVCVGEANDVATAEVYGLVRLGTDAKVSGGAPVGNDEEGRMSVPHADYTVPGVALPSVADVLNEGGAVGFDADGRLLARRADYDSFGAFKPSLSETLDNFCIGLRADGRATVRWATLTDAGVVRLGSEFGQLNPIPYQHGVGVTNNHQLANNLLYGGALQHQRPGAWSGKGMVWLESKMTQHPEFFAATDYFMGLATSGQFAQDEGVGLCLNSASGSLMAGVYVATGLGDPTKGEKGDDRANAVPSASQTADYLGAFYYHKGETFTRDEVRNHVSTSLKSYATMSWVQAQGYDTAASVNAKLGGYMPKSPQVERILVLTRDEYSKLPVRDSKTLYIMAASLTN